MELDSKQVNSIIARAKQENLTEEEVKVYDSFIAEAGAKLNEITLNDADMIVRHFHSSGATNEFIANSVNRLAQLLPANITARILSSDNDSDGVPLYRELELGTSPTKSELIANRESLIAPINKIQSRKVDLEL